VNTTEIFCSILRTRMKKGLPFAIFVKQIWNDLQEKWYKDLLQTLQNFYHFILVRIEAVLLSKTGPKPH
jgi:hypothetical protein